MENLDLCETKKAFAHKDNCDLKKERLLFKTFNIPMLLPLGTKVTSFLNEYNLLPKPLLKNPFFYHFCGGETLEEAHQKTRFLEKMGVERVYFYSVEGKSSKLERDKLVEETIKIFKHQKGEVYSALKISGLISLEILKKKQAKEELTLKEKNDYLDFEKSLEKLCHEAKNNQSHLMIDAEESWVQDVIDALCLEKMRKHNKDFPTVYTTCQMYRKDSYNKLESLIQTARKENFYLGIKLVRGAYLVKENQKAFEEGKPSPIHDNKKETDKAYNKALETCFKNSEKVCLFAGTHNLESSKNFSALYLSDLSTKTNPYFMTSQLKGMCDYITFNLAQREIPVSKYIPFGPVEKSVPYLIRRAEENTAILGETARELSFIEKEIKRREKLH